MSYLSDLNNKGWEEIAEMAYRAFSEGEMIGVEPDDAHHVIYNTDYFIIGRYAASKWLDEHIGAFNAIGAVQEYENDQFGEVYTDLSEPERVANMIAYIAGEEILEGADAREHIEYTKETCERIARVIKEQWDL